jgi:tetratricopeptide (TPR) repeat protein
MLVSSLNFGLPAAIDNLAGGFDLILNSFSFQEMNKLSVETYIDWASKALKKDGILVSFNSHGKAGVRRPADYLRPEFSLLGMNPFRSLPPGFFNTIPYEMVFKKTEINAEKIDHEVSVNAIGELIQLGLDNDLRPLISKFLAHDENTSNILSLVADVFYNESIYDKNVSLNELKNKYPSALSSYLSGNYYFVLNDFENARKCLNESVALGLSNFAGVRARVMLALISRSYGEPAVVTLKQFKINALESTGGLTKEIENIIVEFNIDILTEQIARIMSIKRNRLNRIKTRLIRFRHECLSFLRVSFSK